MRWNGKRWLKEGEKFKSITFSHYYLKFVTPVYKNVPEAWLIEVLEVNLKDLSESFLEYDTTYLVNTKRGDRRYRLPKSGRYLLLIFQGNQGGLFTTLRAAWPPQKVKFYKDARGELFTLRIKDDSR